MKKKQQKVQKKKETDERPEPVEAFLENAVDKKPKDRTIKDYARRFYDIMKNTKGFIDGIFISKQMEESGWILEGNTSLWRIWRQAEHDFPKSIEFTPQSPVFWTKKPSGWRYLGPPDFDNRRKRKMK